MKKVFALIAVILAFPVFAQSYPSKPIRVVVPYTAGGPADLLVRGLGQKLNDLWGQQVIVENKPGANEIIAAQDVAKSPADGYNYLLASDAVFSLNSYLYSKLPYDPAASTTWRWRGSTPRTASTCSTSRTKGWCRACRTS